MAQGSFFITSRTQTPAFQTEPSAELFLEVLQSYRRQHKFTLHAFVVMPDHFHIVLTPSEGITLERSVQYLKGGFSFRAKRELGIHRRIWQPKYHDRRIRDREECAVLLSYLENNPVKRGLAETPSEFPFSSANPRFAGWLDEFPKEFGSFRPQRLKAYPGAPRPRTEVRGLPSPPD
ncbi:MAG: REP-associated tyrosine transposase [Acidobacteriaceae bacterium]